MAKIVLAGGRAAERSLMDNLNANFTEVYNDNTTDAANIVDLQDDVVILALNAVVAPATAVVPAGYRIAAIDIVNTVAAAVTGGVKIGTTEAGDDVVAAQAVGASALVSIADAAILQRLFSTSVPQTLYIDAVTDFTTASLDIRVLLEQVY